MRVNTRHAIANDERGFNLVEVIIAMAILASVLLSVITLFFLSRQNVYSGKQMTQAVAVGTRVLEDLSTMTEDDVFSSFGITDATALQSPTISGTAYTNVILRDTKTFTSAQDPSGYLARWKGLLTAEKFTDSKITLIVMPTSPQTPLTKPITSANFCKIRVIVEWNEATRKRQTFVDTAKVKRS